MEDELYDILVIGGGINGAAVARDAAGRGLHVLLVDAGDFGGETSSASSKLIHGGLRYLEHFEFRLVHESLRERKILMQTAARLVRPLRFLMPIEKGGPRPAWLVGIGLWLYQLLADTDLLPKIGSLKKSEIADLPHIRTANLARMFHYPDCQVDDARLTLELILDAQKKGAAVENYTSVTEIKVAAGMYQATLQGDGGSRNVLARHVVNAAGTHVNKVLDLVTSAPSPEQLPLDLVRGSHIVLPLNDFSADTAFTLSHTDGRVIFVIPWLGRYRLVGTTDAQQRPGGAVACSEAERDYLINAYNCFFDDPVDASDVVWTFAGVRALVTDGEQNPSKLSRDYHLSEFKASSDHGTLLSIYGGKLTTHRALAERVVSRLQKLDGGTSSAGRRSWTADAPLCPDDSHETEYEKISSSTVKRWNQNYGLRIGAFLADRPNMPASQKEVVVGVPEIELEYAFEVELARTGDDFCLRRTKLHLELEEAERAVIDRWFDAKRGGAAHLS